MNNKTVSERLKYLRSINKKTQKDFAEFLVIPQPAMKKEIWRMQYPKGVVWQSVWLGILLYYKRTVWFYEKQICRILFITTNTERIWRTVKRWDFEEENWILERK